MYLQAKNKEQKLLGVQSDEVAKIENPKWSVSKAVLMLLLGSLIAATFADPLVNAVGNFSTATNIPSFLFSFAVLPFASSSEAVSALMFASQKKLRITSLTFSKVSLSWCIRLLHCCFYMSMVTEWVLGYRHDVQIHNYIWIVCCMQIYGAVSMNKLLCLSVFLGLLYFRHLTWNFTSEVLIILIIWSFLPKQMRWQKGKIVALSTSDSHLFIYSFFYSSWWSPYKRNSTS